MDDARRRKWVRRLWLDMVADRRGLSSVEYVVILVLICAVSVAVWRTFGTSLRCALSRVTVAAGFDDGSEGADGCLEQQAALVSEDGVSRRALAPGARSSASSGCGKPTRPNPGPSPGPSTGPSTGPAPKPAPAPAPAPTPQTAAQRFISSVHPIMCAQDKAALQDLKNNNTVITVYDEIYFEDYKYDGTQWVIEKWPAGGSAGKKRINVVLTASADDNAATLYHEAVHTRQPASMKKPQTEYDAYAKEEQWRIDRGLASGGHRKKDASGKDVVDQAAIRKTVDTYPGMVSAPGGGPSETIQKRLPNGNLQIKRANGTLYERAPKKGDTLPGNEVTKPPGGSVVDMTELQCP